MSLGNVFFSVPLPGRFQCSNFSNKFAFGRNENKNYFHSPVHHNFEALILEPLHTFNQNSCSFIDLVAMHLPGVSNCFLAQPASRKCDVKLASYVTLSGANLLILAPIRDKVIAASATHLAESEHDKSLPIMDSHDKSLFWAVITTIYHCLQ